MISHSKSKAWMLAWLIMVGVNGVVQKATAQEYSLPSSTNQPDLETVDPMSQITSVSQLKDVQPTDWTNWECRNNKLYGISQLSRFIW